MFEILIYLYLLCQLVSVSIIDIKINKIPNYFPLANVITYVAFLLLLPSKYYVDFNSLFASVAFIVVGFVLFLLKIMGAGDSKYLFSLFLLIPNYWHDHAVNNLLVSTMLIGSFSLATTVIKNAQTIRNYAMSGHFKGIKELIGSKFPFSPVILLSWLWFGWQVKIFSLL